MHSTVHCHSLSCAQCAHTTLVVQQALSSLSPWAGRTFVVTPSPGRELIATSHIGCALVATPPTSPALSQNLQAVSQHLQAVSRHQMDQPYRDRLQSPTEVPLSRHKNHVTTRNRTQYAANPVRKRGTLLLQLKFHTRVPLSRHQNLCRDTQALAAQDPVSTLKAPVATQVGPILSR